MTSTDRLDALEMRIAHQDATIEELNAAVTAQWAAIDALTRRLAQLTNAAGSVEAGNLNRPEDEPPPPHW